MKKVLQPILVAFLKDAQVVKRTRKSLRTGGETDGQTNKRMDARLF